MLLSVDAEYSDILQRREGEASAWEKQLTLSSLLFIQGHIELQCTRVWAIRWMRSVNRCIFIYCTSTPFFDWLCNVNGI